MRISPLETLLAIKALAFCDDLTNANRRVATLLIESFNRRTGQCDPSIETLAWLLRVSARTVIRSTDAIVAKGYFFKVRHGGNFNRNAYTPNWAKLRAVNEEWTARRKNLRSAKAELSRMRCHASHVQRDADVPRTYLSNLKKEPVGVEPQKNDGRGEALSTVIKRTGEIEERTDAQSAVDERFHVKATSRRDVLRDVAVRRWNADLVQRYAGDADGHAIVIEAMNSDLKRAATDAEIARRGDGLALILRHVALNRRGAAS